MRYVMASAAGCLLQACALVEVESEWLAQPTHPPLPAYHIELSQDELPRACGDAPALGLHGCAVRIPEAQACVIYTTPDPSGWVMDHERRHCAGWDHR